MCGDWCIHLCKGGQISVQSVYPLWDAQHLRDIVLSKGMEYGAISLFASDAGRRGLEAAKYLFVESWSGAVFAKRASHSGESNEAVFIKGSLLPLFESTAGYTGR